MARDKIKSATDQRKFVIVYKDFLADTKLNYYEKLVFISLKSYADNENLKAFPSLKIISKTTGISISQVRRSIDHMEELGVIKVEHRTNKTQGNTSNLYTLYDYAEIWDVPASDKTDEVADKITEAKMIAILRAKGYQITKEPVSLTDQSNETDSSVKNLTCEKSRNNACTQDYKTPQKENQEVFERYPMELVKSTYGYDVLVAQSPTHKEDYDLIINILYDALNTSKPTIRVMGEDKPAMVVISRLLKLSYEHIDYVLQKFEEISANTVIKDTKAYLLTMLYQVIEQYHFDISNLVNYNMAHYEGDS